MYIAHWLIQGMNGSSNTRNKAAKIVSTKTRNYNNEVEHKLVLKAETEDDMGYM